MHGTDLHRPRKVADIENADAPEAFGADILGDTLESAVDPAAGLFHGHDEQIADNRHVALATGADNGAHQGRDTVVLKAVDVEAVIAACNEDVAGKCHVGIGKTE